jgi:hypothetical protein
MRRIFIAVIGICILTALLAQAKAEAPSAVFSMDSRGGASMESSGAFDANFVEGSMRIVADESSAIIETEAKGVEYAYIPDIELLAEAKDGSMSGSLIVGGEETGMLIEEYGEFALSAKITMSGDILRLEISGVLEKSFVYDVLDLDWYYIGENPREFVAVLEEILNDFSDIFSNGMSDYRVESFEIDTKLDWIPGELEIDSNVEFSLVIVGDRFSNTIAVLLNDLAVDEADECMMPALDLSAILLAGGSAEMTVKGEGSEFSLDFSATLSGLTGSWSAEASNKGGVFQSKQMMSGDDTGTFLRCSLAADFISAYDIESLDLLVSKTRDAQGVFTSSAKISNLASRSGQNWQVSFPADVTELMDITIRAPSGMSILSVSGGRKTGERTAVSTSGEDFTVTYGEAGEDYTMWILIAVGVLLLIFLAKRKKA